MTFPDIATLRLCSILASSAFGFVFVVLWLRNRSALHFALWAASSLSYGAAILVFSLLPDDRSPVVTLMFLLLGVSNVLPLAGAWALEGKPIVQRWMAVPVLTAAVGHALPKFLVAAGWITSAPTWQTMGDASGLIVAMGAPGAVLAFGPGARASAGRRMAGTAMLCYLPAYMLSIAGEFIWVPGKELVALFAMLADQILLGVLNLGLLAIPVEQVQRQLRELALRDTLTGCWNRAGLARLAPSYLRANAAVLALDVDQFKQINDHYGHAAGDEVLAFIGSEARMLASGFGAEVVRLGGDEYLVLLPSPARPAQFGALLQDRLMAGRLLDGEWSVSLGLATVRASDSSLDAPIARADAALYAAKEARRPRLRVVESRSGGGAIGLAVQSRAAASKANR